MAFSIYRNGEILGTADADEIGDGPLEALLWLSDRLRDFGLPLKSGQLVLAGSPMHLFPVHAGDRIAVKCRRLGSEECSMQGTGPTYDDRS